MGLYTYYAANPLTDSIIDELPLRNVTFDTKLNGIGSFSAELPLSDSNLVPTSELNSTAPNQTAIWVDRGGVLVWGGLVWTRGYDSEKETVKLGGNDFMSYFEHRFINDTLTYTNVDQLSIVKQLLQYAQGQNVSFPKPGGNVNVQYANPYPTSGILRSATYNSYELKQIAAAIQELSQQDTGFDFGFDVQYVAGIPTVTFNPSYPRRGRTATQTGWVFELPGSISKYTYDEDGTQTEVTSFSVGAGTGSSMLRSSSSTTSLIDNGFPLFEGTHSYKDVADQPTLDAHARADAAAFAGPVALADITVLGSAFSGPITGDDVRIRITDRRFNKGFNSDKTPIGPGLDTFLRIIGIQVTPGDDAMELVKLTLGPAPA